ETPALTMFLTAVRLRSWTNLSGLPAALQAWSHALRNVPSCSPGPDLRTRVSSGGGGSSWCARGEGPRPCLPELTVSEWGGRRAAWPPAFVMVAWRRLRTLVRAPPAAVPSNPPRRSPMIGSSHPRPRLLAAATLCVIGLLVGVHASADPRPHPPMNAAEIRLALDRLEVVGTALMIAAHPDDENTAVLAWLADGRKVRTVD